jgi:DNA (cytosine-5)-methyltransferase 1
MKTIKVGSDFSGVGAFNQALIRLGVNYEEVFACDMDKYARQTFIHNYGEPKYYPTNVYEREIPKESLDIYMTSPPCQAFSLAGKRKGKEDLRGILFFNSLEFIQKNNPRFFIFENVKGLLSDDGGNTFQEWVNLLGGKSVNGVTVLFPYDGSVNYHLYWQVLNSKKHGVPQNRERVFLVGIRDDQDNRFQFPKEEHLSKRLKDVLEESVEDKYFLSEKMLESLTFETKGNYEIANTNKGGQKGIIQSENGEAISCLSATDYKQPKQILINSATTKGYEEAREGDSINFSVPNSETRRGRVGKGVAQTLDTACNQGVMIGAFRGRNPNNPSDRTIGIPTEQKLEINIQGVSNTLTSVQKDNVVIENYNIRRLTPRECFRLMDFPDSFTWPVSDSQAYKQAGNSIVVNVLYKILKQLPL